MPGGTAEKLFDRAAAEHDAHKARQTARMSRDAAQQRYSASRLQFSEEERAVPELHEHIHRAEKAADKLDAAQAAIPKKRVLRKERVFDEASGTAKTKLRFDTVDKSPPKLKSNPLGRPLREVAVQAHGKIHEVEHENVGVESGHKAEEFAEHGAGGAIRWERRHRKLKPYRAAEKAERKALNANAEYLYQKALHDNPEMLSGNPLNRFFQKQRLKREYAKAARTAKAAGSTAQATAKSAEKTVEATATAAKKAAEKAKEAAEFVARHWKGVLVVLAGFLLIVMLIGGLQSCSALVGAAGGGVAASSYQSEDADILAAEAAYCALEAELQEYLDTYERTHDYDEYHYDLDEIKHDPYVLASILSALHDGAWTASEVQGTLQMLFEKQYILTETVVTEVRYRTVLTEFVPYMRLHCNLSEQERTAADMLENGEALTPEQTAYFHAVLAHVDACREKLNAGDYHLPDPPQLSDFDKELQDYKAHVESEIAQEAEAAGMTVEEYAANGYEPQEQPADVQEQPEEAPPADTAPEQTAVRYYTINEGAARRANDANSYRDYAAGSATAEYRQMVDQAAAIAQRQKERVDPMYHEKIDALLDTYARKLAENLNDHYAIEARVPSILVAGGSNFPVRKKEKQNAARDRNMQEWQDVQGILDKIRSTGMGGISMDDPQAAAKLEAKLVKLESAQETMKAVNAYFRKNKTLEGCPSLTPEQITKLQQEMAQSWHLDKSRPYPAYMLSNNNAEIRRIRGRIEQVRQHEDTHFAGWEFDGGRVEANKADNRLQVFFDGKPDEAARDELKANGFRWAPSVGAWQRQLNKNAYYAAGYISCIQPISGEKPIDVQRSAQQQESTVPDAHLTGEHISTPRGSFHVADMTREQMEAAGYS